MEKVRENEPINIVFEEELSEEFNDILRHGCSDEEHDMAETIAKNEARRCGGALRDLVDHGIGAEKLE